MVSAAIIVLLIWPVNIFAFLGVGDIVSDPGSYAYYVEQIKVATDELKNLKEQLETAKSALDETKKMRSLLEGTYNYAKNTIEDLQNFRDTLSSDPSAMLDYAEDFLDMEISDGEDWISAEDLVKSIFSDPREKAQDQIERLKSLSKKFFVRQKNLEQAITKAEDVHRNLPKKYEKIQEIAKKIDETESAKAALDLNNQLLAEILVAVTDLTNLMAYIGEAQAIVNYAGTDAEIQKQEADDLNKTRDASKRYIPQIEYLEEQGVDLNNKSEDEMLRILGQ